MSNKSSTKSFHIPSDRNEVPLSILLGLASAAALFVVMALTQMLGDVVVPEKDLTEMITAYVPPELEVVVDEEPPPPPEKNEPPPELEKEDIQLSLDQLDIALNPGTGGSLAGDFAMPSIVATSNSLGTEDFVDFSDLDSIPRPVGVTPFKFPTRLKKKKVSGRVVLLLKLGESGEVLDVEIDSSNLPRFNEFVLKEVRNWKFSPPTQQGRPVKAKARLPIPIEIK